MMYHTDLVLPGELGTFDARVLSKFDYYVFVIVSSPSEFELALRKFGPTLAACDALCFLVGRDDFETLGVPDVLKALFDNARVVAPTDAVSFILAVSRSDLVRAPESAGRWFELFLSLEDTAQAKEIKLRQGIQAALEAKPMPPAQNAALALQVINSVVRLLLRAVGSH